MSKNPDDSIYTLTNYNNYARMVLKTNVLHHNNDPESSNPTSSGGYKWNNILKDIWKNRKKYEGKGVVVIPSDPRALLERLDLLLASKEVGHKKELKRQGVLDSRSYKKLNSVIKR